MGRTITILGMGRTAVERCVDIKNHVEGEVWGLNDGYLFYKESGLKFDRFFELHNYDYLKDWQIADGSSHFENLHRLGCPIYVTNNLPIVENQVKYKGLEVFSHFETNYFLGSPSLMLALALYEHSAGYQKLDKIITWGIDTQDPSHLQQRSSWSYWISKANAMGITMAGSAQRFMWEKENDEGLQGYREHIGNQMIQKEKQEE